MKFSRYHLLGIASALSIPALVVALDLPHVFQAGDVISAAEVNANFEALRAEVTTLREKVDDLESAQRFGGPAVDLPNVTFTEPYVLYEVEADGFVTFYPKGTGLNDLQYALFVGDARKNNVGTTCEGAACDIATRHYGASGAIYPVKKGSFVAIQLTSAGATTGTLGVRWLPASAADDTKPTFVAKSATNN